VKTLVSVLLSGLVLLAGVPAHRRLSAQQLPTFHTGVDAVQLDVSVLDKDRRPVRGLTAADFTILENGKPRPIVAFSAVELPSLPDLPSRTSLPPPPMWSLPPRPLITSFPGPP